MSVTKTGESIMKTTVRTIMMSTMIATTTMTTMTNTDTPKEPQC